MTGLILPSPSDPPAHDVDEQLELLRVARVEHSHAIARVKRVKAWAADPMLNAADRMRLRIMLDTREHDEASWSEEIARVESRLRAMGLHP